LQHPGQIPVEASVQEVDALTWQDGQSDKLEALGEDTAFPQAQ
jgi:hypothetical protein